MPFEEYMERCNRLLNFCKVCNEIKELNLHYYPADEQTYSMLGNPECVDRIPDDSGRTRYIVQCDTNFYIGLLSKIMDESICTLQSFQDQILSSILGTLRNYQEGNKTAEETASDFFAVYLVSLKAAQTSMYFLCREAGFETDEEAFESSMKQIDDSLNAYGMQVELIDQKMQKIHSSHKREVEELKRVVQKINKQLGHEIQNIQRVEDSYKQELTLLKRDQREMYRLRDLLFTLEHEDVQEDQKEQIALPIRTSDKIYVLGGTPSWITQTKAMLPDLIFLSPDNNMRLDDKLPYAKEIWIQWRALSHAQFNRAVSAISSLNIPVYYFATISPARCAEQFAKAHTP